MATSISGAMRTDELHSLRRTTYTTPTRLPIGPQPVKASHSLLPVLLPDKPTVSSILGSNKPRVILGTAIRQRLSLGATESGENKRPDGSRRSLGDSLPINEAKPADCELQSQALANETAEACDVRECELESSIVVTELQPGVSSPDGPRYTLKRRLGAPETRAPDSPVCKRPLVADERDDLLDDDCSVRYRQRISTNPNCRRSLPGESPTRPASPQPLRPLEHSRSGSMQLLAAYASPTVSPVASRLQKSPRSEKHGHLLTLSTSRLRESAKRKLQSLFSKNLLRETNKENDVMHDILASIKAQKVHARRSSQGGSATPRRVVICDVLANYPDGVRKIRFNRVTAQSELGFHVVKNSPILPLVVTRIEPFCQIPSCLLAVGDEILEINRLNCAASNMSEIIALVRSSAELVLKIKSASRFTENRTFAL